jgi:soluble lytic murein transglycosylase-like protein
MRPILAMAICVLGASSAAAGPNHAAPLSDSARPLVQDASLESPAPPDGGNSAAPADTTGQKPASSAPSPAQSDGQDTSNANLKSDDEASSPAGDDAAQSGISLDRLCQVLFTSAEHNGLPVAFFANLIWQESRLRGDAVSPKGALGIAQFMPAVAQASGVSDPLDPLQALPASAHMLHDLREQFGNLGFVAAAYNAGAKRVNDWLDKHRTLPKETLDYVMKVTGRSVDQWRNAPGESSDLPLASRLPCRDQPAFAQLAEPRAPQPQSAPAPQAPAPKAEPPAPHHPSHDAKTASALSGHKRTHVAQHRHTALPRHVVEHAHTAGHEHVVKHRRVAGHGRIAEHGHRSGSVRRAVARSTEHKRA